MVNLSMIDNIDDDAVDTNKRNSNMDSSTPKPILRLPRRHSIACEKNVSFDLNRNEFYTLPRDDHSNRNWEDEVGSISIEPANNIYQEPADTTNDSDHSLNFNSSEPIDLFTIDVSTIEKVDGASLSNSNRAQPAETTETNGYVDGRVNGESSSSLRIEASTAESAEIDESTTSVDVQRISSESDDGERNSSDEESANERNNADSTSESGDSDNSDDEESVKPIEKPLWMEAT